MSSIRYDKIPVIIPYGSRTETILPSPSRTEGRAPQGLEEEAEGASQAEPTYHREGLGTIDLPPTRQVQAYQRFAGAG